jgi:predicted outer membrane repeat protein
MGVLKRATAMGIALAGTATTMGLLAVDAQAAGTVGKGTPASCTETALDAALAGGGTVTFNCGGAATITVTSPKSILQNTTVKGGGNITLSGGGTTQIFRLAALTTLRLNDITLTDGFSASGGGAIGGSGTLKLTRAVIKNSKTDGCGGAIAMDSTGRLGLTNSTLELNSGAFGGAVCTSGSLTSISSDLVFNHVTGSGGAVYLFPNGVMNLNGGALNGNSATIGGAVILAGNGARVTLRSTGQPISISGNQATHSGGAIYNDPTNVQGYLKISHANFTGNAAPPNVLLSGYGGAIADRGAGMVLTDSTFRQNQGRFGGAVYVGTPGLSASIQRVTFDQNVASRLGGGLYADTQGTTVTLTDGVFTSNHAQAGGAVARHAATLTILNSSITSNTAQSGGGLYNDSGPQPANGGYTEIHDSTIAGNTATLGGGVFNNASANLSNVTVLNNSVGVDNSSGTRLHNHRPAEPSLCQPRDHPVGSGVCGRQFRPGSQLPPEPAGHRPGERRAQHTARPADERRPEHHLVRHAPDRQSSDQQGGREVLRDRPASR